MHTDRLQECEGRDRGGVQPPRSPKVAGAHPKPESGLQEPHSELSVAAEPSTRPNVCCASGPPLPLFARSLQFLFGWRSASASHSTGNPTSMSGATTDNGLKEEIHRVLGPHVALRPVGA